MKDWRMVDEQLSKRMDNGERQGVAQYKFEGKCLKREEKASKKAGGQGHQRMDPDIKSRISIWRE